MKIRFKRLSPTAQTPTRSSDYAAGYDLYADIGDEITAVRKFGNIVIPLNIAMEIPAGYVGLIYARSGLATREGLRPANCVGVIDPDYRGNVSVALHNDSDEARIIQPGQRVAQLVITKYEDVDWEEADELSDTVRGVGGFGSTGA